jgi:hypothetical protein
MLRDDMNTKLKSRDAAIILLRALQERGERRGKQLTRARVSSVSAGWLLVDAGSTYAVVRTSVIENWPRIAHRHLEPELKKIAMGTFDFEVLGDLLDKETWREGGRRNRKSR